MDRAPGARKTGRNRPPPGIPSRPSTQAAAPAECDKGRYSALSHSAVCAAGCSSQKGTGDNRGPGIEANLRRHGRGDLR